MLTHNKMSPKLSNYPDCPEERVKPEAEPIVADLVSVQVAGGQRARQVSCLRRRSEADLWRSLSPLEERAACAIGAAHAIVSRGLGYRSGMPEVKGWEDPLEEPRERLAPDERLQRQAFLCHCYFDWQKACAREGINHEAVMDVLGRGLSLRAVERQRRKRNGWMRGQLAAALELYALDRGWIARKAA